MYIYINIIIILFVFSFIYIFIVLFQLYGCLWIEYKLTKLAPRVIAFVDHWTAWALMFDVFNDRQMAWRRWRVYVCSLVNTRRTQLHTWKLNYKELEIHNYDYYTIFISIYSPLKQSKDCWRLYNHLARLYSGCIPETFRCLTIYGPK